MSLLLKALEKSEEGQEKVEDGVKQGQKVVAPSGSPAAGIGGMKLSGGGAKGSKLGSALAGSAKGKSVAKKVVSAYDELSVDQVSAEQEELLQASRKSRARNFVKFGVFVVVIAGGWVAFQQFGSNFFPADQGQDQAQNSSSSETTTAAPTVDNEDDVALLPLAEPIYDIQENILAASTGGVSTQSEDGDIIKEVESYVERILEEQLRKSQQLANKVAGENFVDTSSDVVTERLSEEVAWEEIAVIDASTSMLAELEELSSKKYQKGSQFIQRTDFALVGDEVAASPSPEEIVKEEMPARVVQITKKSNGFHRVMEKAVEQYRAGDLSAAELSFRTILATEPKNTNALVGLAKVHQSRGDLRLAVATLLKAGEYSPNNPIVVSELIAIQQSSSSASSVLPTERVSELLSLTRDNKIRSRLLFILGNESAKKKDWNVAKSMFHSAHQLNPGNPDIAYNLAVIYDHLGEQASAVAMYNHALRSTLVEASSFRQDVAEDRVRELSGR